MHFFLIIYLDTQHRETLNSFSEFFSFLALLCDWVRTQASREKWVTMNYFYFRLIEIFHLNISGITLVLLLKKNPV